MKIAFVSDCYWPRVNGVTVSMQTFRDRLEALGHRTMILAPEYPGAELDPAEPPVRRFKSVSARLSHEDRVVRPDAFPAIFRALDEFKPDIVHFHTEFGMFLGGQIWCRTRKVPVVITCHTNWEFYFHHYAPWIPHFVTRGLARKLMRRAYLESDYVLIPGTMMGELLSSYGVNGPFHFLPTGINRETFLAEPAEILSFRRAWDQEAPQLRGKRIMLYVGRIGEEKNVSFLLPVLRRVAAALPDAALVLIGDGPMRKPFLAKAAEQGLADRVHAPGYLPRERLRLAYAAASVFVFPSMTETQGLTTIEAMMCGTPAVAIGEMGTKDVMQGDNGGFMVPRDEEAFAAAAIRILSDHELRKAKSDEARAWAMRFSVKATTESLLGHYEACLAGQGRRR